MAYLLDANVFLAAKNLHYGFDFCPAFWEWLITQNAGGRVFSIERVGDELTVGDDALADWAADRGDGFFLKPDAGMLQATGALSTWVTSARYTPAAQSTFFSAADYYLVATALAKGWTVVTHEVAAQTPNKVKIPNACIEVGVKCVNPFGMLRMERARFVLGPVPLRVPESP